MMKDRSRMLNRGNVIVFTSSGRLSGDFSYLDDNNVRPFSEETLVSVIRLQQRRIELLKRRSERSGNKVMLPPLLICLDDPQSYSHRSTDGGKSAFHSKAVEFLYTVGRHYRISLYCNIQHSTSLLNVACRNQTTHLLMSSMSTESLRACYKLIDGVASFQQFARMVASLHEHCFLLFDTTRPAGQRFRYVRAPGYGKFLVRIAAPPSSKKAKDAKKKTGKANE